ncbi:hypothetical protein BDQ94DRAFT_137857 [Aspergillus welwitschiae]|uniref:Uncharacterized protein n=1 Tax=Aspergillus welwitschiae TaxID=1341132 RepID=A0A3F3QB75_9EURO|nr:hypothetical protein BDQ94DRAFT_137857 [Aspergillus welwitschiae]RDH36481.1 hypothetical protein BDQ94DRAFT_137857 [Aspergillus welwitschiae]
MFGSVGVAGDLTEGLKATYPSEGLFSSWSALSNGFSTVALVWMWSFEGLRSVSVRAGELTEGLKAA